MSVRSLLSPGLWLMVESAMWFSLMGVFVKLAGRTVPFEQIVLARCVVALVMSAWAVRRDGVDWRGNRRGLLLLRGLFGFIGLMCFYFALTSLPLADATVIQYTNPAIVGLLGGLVLGERTGGATWLGGALCLLGVALVAQPAALFGGGLDRLEPSGVAIASLGALFSACAYLTVRRLTASEAPMVIVLWFPLVATPLALPMALWSGYLPGAYELMLLVGVGVATQLAQVRMTRGFALESASRATSVTYLQVVFATAWGVLLFGERPNALALAGAALVVAATLLVSRRG